MLLKGAGAICWHCRRAEAAHSCKACRHEVCAACLAEWKTCPEPRGRELRLGRGARLRAVDRAGRRGLVTTALQTKRILDLDGPRLTRWPKPATRGMPTELGGILLTSAGHVIHVTAGQAAGMVIVRHLDGLAESDVPHGGHMCRGGDLRLSRDERAVSWLRRDEQVELLDLATARSSVLNPAPGQVLQAASYDAERRLLVTGVYGRIHLHGVGVGGSRLQPRGVADVADSDILWVAVAGARVVGLCARSSARFLVVFDLEGHLALPRRATFEWQPPAGAGLADASDDGHYVAIAQDDHRIALVDLATTQVDHLEGHTDRISLLQFTRGDLLISADDDNRVLVTPRGSRDLVHERIQMELSAPPRSRHLAPG